MYYLFQTEKLTKKSVSFVFRKIKISMNRTGWLFFSFAFVLRMEAQQVSLLFAGDAMQHRVQLENAWREGRYDYSSYFEAVKEVVSGADIAVVNLETTLGGRPYRGYPMFCSPDEYAVALKEAGFDVFLTANNHILDRSSKGMHRTLDVLDSLGVKHTGVFRDSGERERVYPLMVEKNGIRFAFLNYTYGTNGMKPARGDVVNYIDRPRIRADIERARLLKADLIVANMHWGTEYRSKPNNDQKQLAQWLMNEGVDVVMGNHPHVVQPARVVWDAAGALAGLVVYSLGNLVSGMTAAGTDGGQLMGLVVEKRAGKVRIVRCGYRLVFVERTRKGKGVDYRVVLLTDSVEAGGGTRLGRFAANARAVLEGNKGVGEGW
jgi:poly-gamma-glutamate synthesis protein (capsule biosynthesis protein)